MAYTYNKLRGRIIEKYRTQSAFAQAVGISINALSEKMNGKLGISQSDIVKWSELLDIDSKDYGDYFFT